jgi:hypothetical protein
MTYTPPVDVAGPGLLIFLGAFGIVFFCVLLALIVTVETTALQLQSWGPFRVCLKAALIMNLVSSLVGFAAYGLVPALKMFGILISWALSVWIEGFVLSRMAPGNPRRAYRVALVANLASYLILIVPAYLTGLSLD